VKVLDFGLANVTVGRRTISELGDLICLDAGETPEVGQAGFDLGQLLLGQGSFRVRTSKPIRAGIAIDEQAALPHDPDAEVNRRIVQHDEINRRGASWADDGSIVFSPDIYSGLWRVSASGGSPQALTELDGAGRERNHRWPDVLPGSQAVLFTVGTGGTLNDARIVVQALESGKRTTIVEGGTNPRYIPTGHIVYSRDGALTAIPFDLERLQATGPPVKVLDDVLTESSGAAQFSFSAAGTLVAVPGRGLQEGVGTPVWVDRRGRVTPTALKVAQYRTARLSPDGTRIVSIRNDVADAGLWGPRARSRDRHPPGHAEPHPRCFVVRRQRSRDLLVGAARWLDPGRAASHLQPEGNRRHRGSRVRRLGVSRWSTDRLRPDRFEDLLAAKRDHARHRCRSVESGRIQSGVFAQRPISGDHG